VKFHDLDTGDVFPAWWTDALQELLGSYASSNFELSWDADSIDLAAGAGDAQVGLAIDGLWRYITAPIVVAPLGGVARDLDLYAVCSENNIAGEDDDTDYSFGLRLVESAATPSGTHNGNAISNHRKVATAHWDGAAFDRLETDIPSRNALWRDLLAQGDAADIFTMLGVSAFVQTLLNDADAATARATLGLTIGTDVQGYDADLAALAAVVTTAYGRSFLALADASAAQTLIGMSAFVKTLMDDADAAAFRSTLGIDADDSVTFGSLTLGTDLSVANGGTGASDAPTARTNLGVNYEAPHMSGTYAARPAASSALNGVRYFATDKYMEFQCVAGVWVLMNAYPRRVSEPPQVTPGVQGATPSGLVDGEEIEIFPPGPTYDTTPPVTPQFDEQLGEPLPWRFRWDAVRQVWQFVGGPRVYDEWIAYWADPDDFDDFTTPSTANEATTRPMSECGLVIPWRGIYEVQMGAMGWKNTTNTLSGCGMHMDVGGVDWGNYHSVSLQSASSGEMISWEFSTDVWSVGNEELLMGFSSSPGSRLMRITRKSMSIRPRILYYSDW
jgi:hypothetical protein